MKNASKARRQGKWVVLISIFIVFILFLTQENKNNDSGPEWSNVTGLKNLPAPDFGTLSEGMVYQPKWFTKDGDLMVGTACVVAVEGIDEPICITAFHCFQRYDTVNADEMPTYVQGGELYDIFGKGTKADCTVTETLEIPEAVSLGAGRDLAAFLVEDYQGTVIEMSDTPCEPEDTIYLAAKLGGLPWRRLSGCLYPCKVTAVTDYEIAYELPEQYNLSGTSGAPLLNSKGELVGIHKASRNQQRFGDSVKSIKVLLKNALQDR